MINHQGRIITLFSRVGNPYYNKSAAYLTLDLTTSGRGALDLVEWITTI
jgi:hypothetical protein